MKKFILGFIVIIICQTGFSQKNLRELIKGDEGVSKQFLRVDTGKPVVFNPANAKAILGLDANTDLVLISKDADQLGFEHFRYYQTYKAIPVENSMYLVHTKNRSLVSMGGAIVLDFDSPPETKAAITPATSIQAAKAYVNATKYAWEDADLEKRVKLRKGKDATYFPTPQIVWFSADDVISSKNLRLAYKIDIYASVPLDRKFVYVDAQTGKILGEKAQIMHVDATGTASTGYSGTQTIHSDKVNDTTYRLRDMTKGNGIITLRADAGHTDYISKSQNWVLDGEDKWALDVHYGVSSTWTFYKNNFNRNSVDNNGYTLTSWVNDKSNDGKDNAYWDGTEMVFGNLTSNRNGVVAIDITGHELTHAVTQYTSGLIYAKEPGAINESLSDIMGKSVQFYTKPSDIDWKLSNDMSWFIRNMANPNDKNHPDTYKGDYWEATSYDNYGVHINSGVGNFMFYLLVNGGSGVNDKDNTYSVSGIGLAKAYQIIYRSNAYYLVSNSKYADWRLACINAATDLYGASSNEVTQVRNAWYAVGVGSVDVLFLIDDTGSMGEEIGGVRNALTQYLATFTTNPGLVFQLVTYKDNITMLSPTTELSVIRSQVSGLVASGGGDCPEASAEAFDAIKLDVVDGGLIFHATDASPHPGTDIEGITAAIRARGIKINTLLSGDCTTSSLRSNSQSGQDQIPYSSNDNNVTATSGQLTQYVSSSVLRTLPTNPTAVQAFTYMSGETNGIFAFVSEVNNNVPADRTRYQNIAYNMIVGGVTLSIVECQPRKAPLNGTIAFTLYSSNTHFNSTTALSFSEASVQILNYTIVSPTEITGTLKVNPGTVLGFKDVSAITSLGGGINETANGIGVLEVTTAPTTPTILSISPATGTEGKNLTVKITGINTSFASNSVVNLGTGITILNTTVLNNQELLADIQISPTANIGFRNVIVTTGSQVATENVVGPFLVVAFAGTNYYSKAAGNLHDLATWGSNTDGTGTPPADFGSDKTFNLVNRGTTYTLTNNWTVEGVINIPSGSQLQINGFTLNESGLTGSGNLSGSATSNLIVSGNTSGDAGVINFSPAGNTLNNLTVNRTGTLATATIGSSVNIVGVLSVTGGTLNTGNALTLKSNATNTARVAPVTGIINGDVTVERYIPAKRAWRILSAPVTGTQTVNQAWQEGSILGQSANANPFPGFGTHITGGSIANGFDQNVLGGSSSIKVYLNNVWTPLSNSNATPVGSNVFMTFIRGSRDINLSSSMEPANNTVLRARGPLKIGDQVFNVAPTGFTAVGNPFASPIDFATITRNGVQNNFYLWDPKMGGANGVGAYVLLSFNGVSYDITPASVSPESQYIQSGQGFLVRPATNGAAGTITIKESDKSSTTATDVFRTTGGVSSITSNAIFADPNSGQGLRVRLQGVNMDGSATVLDEAFASFKNSYSDKLDDLDAVKLENVYENIGIMKEGQTFMVERKTLPREADKIELRLWNTAQKSYVLELQPVGLSSTSLPATVEDKYLKTSTVLSLDEKSQIPFTITNDPASSRTDRFVILFGRKALTDITSVVKENAITAYPNPINGKNITLSFNNKSKGIYQVMLVNSLGQVMFRKSVQHAGNTATHVLQLNEKLSQGVYQLTIISKEETTNLSISSN